MMLISKILDMPGRPDLRTKASYPEQAVSFDFLVSPFSLCINFSSAMFVVPEGEHFTKCKVRKDGWEVSLHTFVYTELFKAVWTLV